MGHPTRPSNVRVYQFHHPGSRLGKYILFFGFRQHFFSYFLQKLRFFIFFIVFLRILSLPVFFYLFKGGGVLFFRRVFPFLCFIYLFIFCLLFFLYIFCPSAFLFSLFIAFSSAVGSYFQFCVLSFSFLFLL